MSTIPQSARDLLATGPWATIVTLNPDGTPHISLAWAGFDGDEVVFSTFHADQHKIQNLRRDPRVSLSFIAPENPGGGLHPYLVIRGRVRAIEEGGALDVMDKLAEHYIGLGAKYPWRDAPAGQVIHVTVDKLYGQGPWREPAAGEAREG